MNIKLTHQYLINKDDEVFVEALSTLDTITEMCAVIQFVAENYVDDCCTISPALMGIILEEMGYVVSVEYRKTWDEEVDLYCEREVRCGGWYREEFEKFKPSYDKIKYLIDENTDLIW